MNKEEKVKSRINQVFGGASSCASGSSTKLVELYIPDGLQFEINKITFFNAQTTKSVALWFYREINNTSEERFLNRFSCLENQFDYAVPIILKGGTTYQFYYQQSTGAAYDVYMYLWGYMTIEEN